MNGNPIMPSTKMMPMEDISNELRIKYGHIIKTEAATDTQKVSGVPSEDIAIATENDSEDPIQPRETVRNSLRLGGYKAEDYVTKEKAISIETFGSNVSKIYADEVRSLRDELYQLRAELAKNGFVNGYTLYSGFQDFFRGKYPTDPICNLIDPPVLGQRIIRPSIVSEFEVGDWIVLGTKQDEVSKEERELVQITKKNVDGSIEYEPDTAAPLNSETVIYKVKGQYNDGHFAFSNVEYNSILDTESQTMLNDDYDLQDKIIQQPNTGYAAQFYIPQYIGGALSKLSIKAKATGSPSALICFMIKPEDITKFRNLNQAENDGIVFAKSQPIRSDMARGWTMVDFSFRQADGTYPKVSQTVSDQYIFVIQPIDNIINPINAYWEIKFAKDIKSNNKCWSYTTVSDIEPIGNYALTNSKAISNDLFFVLTTNKIAAVDEKAYNDGLYTAKFELPSPIEVSRARLTLRVNREGGYVAKTSKTCSDISPFDTQKDPSFGVYDYTSTSDELGINANDMIAIGTDIRKVYSASGSQITLEKATEVVKDSPVYRIGYKVILKAWNRKWNPATKVFEESEKYRCELPLVCVLPDGKKLNPNYSDRIIFEGDIYRDEVTNIPEYFNTFELQIKWNSNFRPGTLNSYKELIGRIYDMSLVFDKSL